MKICLLDLNRFEITGESPYLIHMQAGLEKLGILSEIVATTASGRRPKWSVDYPITWVKHKNFLAHLKSFDLIHFNNGCYGEKKYEYLKGVEDLKVPKTLQIHGVTQSKAYNLPYLIERMKFKAIFNVDPIGVEEYKKYGIPVYWTELPFCQELMPLGKRILPIRRIVVPTRFSFIKYPGEVLEIFSKLNRFGFTIDFYGYESFVANAQDCREEFEYLDKLGKVKLNHVFQHQDKFRVYNGAMFMMDGTRIKGMGGNRIQYATLEAMFYGVIPVIHLEWHHVNVKAITFDLELIETCLDNPQLRRNIQVANYRNLKHYAAERVCRVHKNVWENL